MQPIRHFLIVVQFFTRLPITGRLANWVGFNPAMLQASAAYFPAVGWLVGALVQLVTAALAIGLDFRPMSAWVAVAVATGFGLLVTGAFHEDGLADSADGLGGSQDRERALVIMKDSRIGTFGAVALVMTLLIKVTLLVWLVQFGWAALLVAGWTSHVVSRYWPLWVIRCLAHVGDDAGSKSKPLAKQISLSSLVLASAFCLPALVLTGAHMGALVATSAFGLSALMWWVLQRWLHQRLHGFTGDGLGLVQQMTELAYLLGIVLALANTDVTFRIAPGAGGF